MKRLKKQWSLGKQAWHCNTAKQRGLKSLQPVGVSSCHTPTGMWGTTSAKQQPGNMVTDLHLATPQMLCSISVLFQTSLDSPRVLHRPVQNDCLLRPLCLWSLALGVILRWWTTIWWPHRAKCKHLTLHTVSNLVLVMVSSHVLVMVSSLVLVMVSSLVLVMVSSLVLVMVSSLVLVMISSLVLVMVSSLVLVMISSLVLVMVSSLVLVMISSLVLVMISSLVLPTVGDLVLPTVSDLVLPTVLKWPCHA